MTKAFLTALLASALGLALAACGGDERAPDTGSDASTATEDASAGDGGDDGGSTATEDASAGDGGDDGGSPRDAGPDGASGDDGPGATDGGGPDGGGPDGGGPDGGGPDGGGPDGGPPETTGADFVRGAGTYYLKTFTIGAFDSDVPLGWAHGEVTVADDGTFTSAFSVRGDRSSSTRVLDERLSLLPSGRIYAADSRALAGSLASDGSSLVLVSPLRQTLSLYVLQRRPGMGVPPPTLDGQWSVHTLELGAGVAGSRAYVLEIDGGVARAVSTRAVVGVPMVAEPFGRIYRGARADGGGEYTLFAGAHAFAGVERNRDDGGDRLELAVKRGTGMGSADLAGDWTFTVLFGGSEPVAGDGVLRVDEAGRMRVLFQRWSAPRFRFHDGVFAVGEAGEVSTVGNGLLRGQLSADANLVAATLADGEGSGLLIAQRRSAPPTALAHPDADRSVTEMIGTGGGSVSATGADGVRYELEVPPGALSQTQPITVTPVASVEGELPEGRLLGLARLEPDGLALQAPATLRIVPTSAPGDGVLRGFGHDGVGADRFDFMPAVGAGQGASVALVHFSLAGLLEATQGHVPVSVLESLFNSTLEELLAGRVDLPDASTLHAGLDPYIEAWLASLTVAAGAAHDLHDLRTGVVRPMLNLAAALQLLGLDDAGPCLGIGAEGIDALVKAIRDRARDLIAALLRDCAMQDDCEKRDRIRAVLSWIALSQALGGSCGVEAEPFDDIETACGLPAGSLLSGSRAGVNPVRRDIPVGQVGRFRLMGLFGSPVTEGIQWAVSGDAVGVSAEDGDSIWLTAERAPAVVALSGSAPEACASGAATISTSPAIEGRWTLEVTERLDVQSSCQALELPSPSLVTITTHSDTTTGELLIDMQGYSDTFTGSTFGGVATTIGNSSWFAFSNDTRRDCTWRLPADAAGAIDAFSGTCEFLTAVSGGCQGTDQVEATRIVPDAGM